MRTDLPQDLTRLPPRVLFSPAQEVLSPTELRHLRSLRWQADEPVLALDGAGAAWLCHFDPDGQLLASNPYPIETYTGRNLVVALPDRTAFKDVVRTATMFGAETVWLYRADHSHSHGFKLKQSQLEKAQTWVAETAKQALVARFPELVVANKLADLPVATETKPWIVLDPRGTDTLPQTGGLPWVGPEGGWSQREWAFFQEQGARICRLPVPVLTVPRAVAAALTWQALQTEPASV